MKVLDQFNTSDFYIESEPLTKEILIRKNVKVYLGVLFFSVFFIILIISSNWPNVYFQYFFGLVFGLISVFAIWNIFDSSIQIKINDIGILIKGRKMFLWKEIKKVFIKKVLIDENESSINYFLSIQLTDEQIVEINLSNLDHKYDWIASKIEGFKLLNKKNNVW